MPGLKTNTNSRKRVDALNRKLAVVAETANTLADIIDTRRSLRLELIVVVLIAFEIVITFYQIYAGRGPKRPEKLKLGRSDGEARRGSGVNE